MKLSAVDHHSLMLLPSTSPGGRAVNMDVFLLCCYSPSLFSMFQPEPVTLFLTFVQKLLGESAQSDTMKTKVFERAWCWSANEASSSHLRQVQCKTPPTQHTLPWLSHGQLPAPPPMPLPAQSLLLTLPLQNTKPHLISRWCCTSAVGNGADYPGLLPSSTLLLVIESCPMIPW